MAWISIVNENVTKYEIMLYIKLDKYAFAYKMEIHLIQCLFITMWLCSQNSIYFNVIHNNKYIKYPTLTFSLEISQLFLF